MLDGKLEVKHHLLLTNHFVNINVRMALTPENFLLTIQPWFQTNKDQIIALYGFGSFFGGGFNKTSDIDLAILPREEIAAIKRWQWQNELANLLKRDIDLVDLRKASTVMKAQIIGNGSRLYCSDQTACNFFETYALSSYANLNESRKEILEDILQRGSVYGG